MDSILRFVGLDIEFDKELQEIVELACAICGVPTAFITFVDHETQHLKVKRGLHAEINSLPLKDTFCTYTLQQDDVMIIPNALTDPRFADNQIVINNPELRFYAGTPLVSNTGDKIGTFCIINSEETLLTEHQRHMMKIMAKQVMKVVELKLRAQILEDSLKEMQNKQEFFNDASTRLRSFFESSTNFHVLLGRNGELIDFNKIAFRFVKKAHGTNMKRGDLFVTYIAPEFVAKFIDGYYAALNGDKHLEEGSTHYGELGIIYWDATFEPAYDNENNIIGISYIIRDVTDRNVRERKILEQNESLMHIAHMQAHEFRAPLTTIMGLMDLIKDDHYSLAPTYLLHLDQAVQNLDGKIRHIVEDIIKVTV